MERGPKPPPTTAAHVLELSKRMFALRRFRAPWFGNGHLYLFKIQNNETVTPHFNISIFHRSMTNDFGVRDAKFDSIQEIENQMILNFWSKTDRHHFGFNGSFSLGFEN